MSGYEAVRIYGENTLELKGMPLGKTPEYVQAPNRAPFFCVTKDLQVRKSFMD